MTFWKTAACLITVCLAASAASARELPYANTLGITVNMEDEGGQTADPAGRLSAAIIRLQGTLGPAQKGADPKVDTSSGHTLAVVARQFQKDPGQIHMLMASDAGSGVCHIRAPARAEVQSEIAKLLLVCVTQFGKGGGGTTPATAAPKPATAPAPVAAAPVSAASGARYAQNWAQVDGVYFRMIYTFGGVGGMMIMDFEPIILFKDGSYYEIRDRALEDIDLAAERRAKPKQWGRWSKRGAAFVLTGSTGKANRYELQQGQFFKAFPASAGSLMPKYKAMSGGGNSAMGGGVTIAIQSQFAFTKDGKFARGSNVGALNSGDWTGVSSAVSSRGGKAGTYTVKDHTLTLTYSDGTVERKFFAFGSRKTPAIVDTGMIFVGDNVYTDGD